MSKPVIILANGRFPGSGLALGYLNNAERIVCCDGSVANLIEYGLEPWAIAGDLDSVPDKLRKTYAARLYHSDDQETNDLTKAVKFCLEEGITDIVILGATGLREDHTLGNISLLADYAESVSVRMVTDYGIFIPAKPGKAISSWPGQQVSIFAIDKGMFISSTGLKYPLKNIELENWWMGTLNESTGDNFSLDFNKGRVLVFLEIPT
ncbi:MAG TPA: thiamine diphosphokinase [Bacteroidetes bacterium]|nr:thiamine diphosphokinase [Bacteroidota bacterium]